MFFSRARSTIRGNFLSRPPLRVPALDLFAKPWQDLHTVAALSSASRPQRPAMSPPYLSVEDYLSNGGQGPVKMRWCLLHLPSCLPLFAIARSEVSTWAKDEGCAFSTKSERTRYYKICATGLNHAAKVCNAKTRNVLKQRGAAIRFD